MNIRWLGWAGVELESGGRTLVIDALGDAGAVFAAFGDPAGAVPLPPVAQPTPSGAVAAAVTHLHRDHADAAAIAAALAGDGVVLEPPAAGGDGLENLGVAQADAELEAAGLERRRMSAWDTTTAGPFEITALPAVDGLGDPQVSWLVAADGVRVLHLGDTMFHHAWWRIARRCGPFDVVFLPVNGAVVGFPHRQPPSPYPAAMDPEQAAVAAQVLGARLALPIHADGYDFAGIYEPSHAAAQRFAQLAAARGVEVAVPVLGEPLDLGAAVG